MASKAALSASLIGVVGSATAPPLEAGLAGPALAVGLGAVGNGTSEPLGARLAGGPGLVVGLTSALPQPATRTAVSVTITKFMRTLGRFT